MGACTSDKSGHNRSAKSGKRCLGRLSAAQQWLSLKVSSLFPFDALQQVKYIGADWERWDHLRGWKRERVRVKPAERVYAIEKKPQAAELWLPRLSIPQLAACYYLILLGTTTWYCLLLFVMTKMNNLTSGHNCPRCPHRWQVWKELTKDQAKSCQSYCLCSCSKGSPFEDIAGVHHTVRELIDNNLNHLERAGFLQREQFVSTIFSFLQWLGSSTRAGLLQIRLRWHWS